MNRREAAQFLSTDVLRSPEEVSAIVPDWKRIYQEDPTKNPFNHPSWTLRWIESSFFRETGQTKDRLAIMVHSDSQANIRAITPLVETQRATGPASIKKIRTVGFAPQSKPLEIAPHPIELGWEAATAEAVTRTLYDLRGDFHWAEISGVYRNTQYGRSLENTNISPWYSQNRWLLSEPYFILDLSESWEEFRSNLKRNTKDRLNQGYNRLNRREEKDKNGKPIKKWDTWHVEFVTDPEQLPGALHEFFDLHGNRANYQSQESEHQNHFPSKDHQDYLSAVASDLAQENALQIARLKIDEQTVASRVLLPSQDQLFLYYSGFDTNWYRTGVMMTLTAEVLRMAIEARNQANEQIYHSVHLSTGNDRGKKAWLSDEQIACAPHVGTLRLSSPAVRALPIDIGAQLLSSAKSFTQRTNRVAR